MEYHARGNAVIVLCASPLLEPAARAKPVCLNMRNEPTKTLFFSTAHRITTARPDTMDAPNPGGTADTLHDVVPKTEWDDEQGSGDTSNLPFLIAHTLAEQAATPCDVRAQTNRRQTLKLSSGSFASQFRKRLLRISFT